MKRLKKLLPLAKTLIFLLILALLLVWFTDVLRDKNGAETMLPYYDEPRNSLDILFIGSSHMMCGISPMELYERYGYTSYVFSSSAQVIPQSYYQLSAALETQTPQLVVLDMGELVYETKTGNEAFIHAQTDNLPFFSPSRLRLIHELLEPSERLPNYFNLIQFHSRWQELTEDDFKPVVSYTKGARYTHETTPLEPPTVPTPQPGDALPALTDGYLRKMLELCQARGIPVLLLYLPSNLNETDYRKVFTAAQYAEEYGVRFLNLLDHADALGLDYQHDFRDRFHLNSFGAGKATAFLGEYLETHYSIDRDRPAEITDKWNRDLADYYAWIETQ